MQGVKLLQWGMLVLHRYMARKVRFGDKSLAIEGILRNLGITAESSVCTNLTARMRGGVAMFCEA
jgi:hypothetical protein